MSLAVIRDVRVAAAHDGDAELMVTLEYENGGTSLVALDEYAARTLLESCAATSPEGLIGAGWEKVRDALVASSQRYAGVPAQEHSGGE
ncbi:hypothetical protein [Hyphomonas sp.]|uniref:hypothetical protein n=1 Tax=Hyphomonas sp. TaxID=87 RepID=UPI003919EC8E